MLLLLLELLLLCVLFLRCMLSLPFMLLFIRCMLLLMLLLLFMLVWLLLLLLLFICWSARGVCNSRNHFAVANDNNHDAWSDQKQLVAFPTKQVWSHKCITTFSWPRRTSSCWRMCLIMEEQASAMLMGLQCLTMHPESSTRVKGYKRSTDIKGTTRAPGQRGTRGAPTTWDTTVAPG